jgi:hypothetical protein
MEAAFLRMKKVQREVRRTEDGNRDINDLVSFSINEGAETGLVASIRYIHMFCPYKHLSETVELKFSQNIPLAIYNIA